MRYVVMSGRTYGHFTVASQKGVIIVRDVSWQEGAPGLKSATKFSTRKKAEMAAGQVEGLQGSPLIVEVEM